MIGRAAARPRAQIVGMGLIGGSLGLALRDRGWIVTGRDAQESRAERALEMGALDLVGSDPDADLTFVAVPVSSIADEVRRALDETTGLVTDVGSVKASVTAAIDDPRFIGGHPMAGSEREGVDGSDASLFTGAVWVLTPTATTDNTAFTQVRGVVSQLGAEVVSLTPTDHDALVAIVSHVPHLTAATLMVLADARSSDQRALLRLAAGGFRDMTRVASGHPGIWPDICAENREAIVDVLDELIDRLGSVRELVASDDADKLVTHLERARTARMNLPMRFGRPTRLVEILVPVADETGALAPIVTLATELDVNIWNLELSHSAEGHAGVLHLVVEEKRADELRAALVDLGHAASSRRLV
ncbi:MAG: prephenate dehydrogenase/arogenate dehydrogenase family protein [Actinomycetota bacterium]|nr:prephenate dehydrogenase/arogenate dehydrogenase family protein [Actinomycetota bacterium]